MLLGGLLSSANGLGGRFESQTTGPQTTNFPSEGFVFELHPLLEFHQVKVYMYGMVL